MADFVILEDVQVAGPSGPDTLVAGTLVSDSQYDVPKLKKQGAAIVPFDPLQLEVLDAFKAGGAKSASLVTLLLVEGLLPPP